MKWALTFIITPFMLLYADKYTSNFFGPWLGVGFSVKDLGLYFWMGIKDV